MRILFDQCVPKRLRRLLPGHWVRTTGEMGWGEYQNGRLLALAQSQFDVLLTVDKNIPYQQNMSGRPIALLIVDAKNNTVPTLATAMPAVLALLPTVLPGQVYRVQAIVPEVAGEAASTNTAQQQPEPEDAESNS